MGLGKWNGKRHLPISPYKGSWAQQMEEARKRTDKEAAKDKRPTSIMGDGIVTLSNGLKVEFTSNGRI